MKSLGPADHGGKAMGRIEMNFARLRFGFLLAALSISAALSSSVSPAAVPGAALGKLPRAPLLFQINTRVVLDKISVEQKKRATLDDFPDKETISQTRSLTRWHRQAMTLCISLVFGRDIQYLTGFSSFESQCLVVIHSENRIFDIAIICLYVAGTLSI